MSKRLIMMPKVKVLELVATDDTEKMVVRMSATKETQGVVSNGSGGRA
jgi:hypothetical protein